MRIPAPPLILLLLLAASLRAGAADAATGATRSGFTTERVAEGVYALIRREPPGLWFEANSVFLIGPDDVIVVDTGMTLEAARAALAELRRLSDKPVRYVVNTHWHDDHLVGNQVYREAFPGVDFIAQASAPADMAGTGAKNRAGNIEHGAGFAATLHKLIGSGKNFLGQALAEDERAGYAATATLVEQYLREAPSVRIIAPTVLVHERLTLMRGGHPIEIRHPGAGHTAADLVVYLPDAGVLIAGDTVVWPVPLVGSTSYPAQFSASLARLLALKPNVIVPGHGPVLHDDRYLRQEKALLDDLVAQTRSAIAAGANLEQTRKRVDLSRAKAGFIAGSAMRSFIFDNYVTDSGVAAAYRELGGKTETPGPGS